MDQNTSPSFNQLSHRQLVPVLGETPASPAWPAWVGCLTLFALIVAIQAVTYWPTYTSLAEHWIAHHRLANVLLATAFSGYFAYTNRGALTRCRPDLTLTGVAAVAGFSLLWTAGTLVGDNAVMGIAMIGMIHATCLAFFGHTTLHLLRAPLAMLWILAPIDNAIAPLIQSATFHATDFFLQSLLAYHYTEGFSIETAVASFTITPATLGMPTLQTGMLLAVAISFAMRFTLAGTLVFVIAAAATLVILNAARLAITIFTATAAGTPYSISAFDPITSWIVALGALYIAYRVVKHHPFDRDTTPSGERVLRTRRPATSFLACVILASLLLPNTYRVADRMPALPPVTLNIPDQLGYWIAQTERQETRQIKDHPQTTFIKKFESENCCIELMIAYNWAGTKALSHADIKTLMTDSTDWRLVRADKNTLPHDPIARVNTAELASPTNQKLVWYFYWAGNKYISSAFDLGTQQLKNIFTRADRRNAIIAVSTSLSEGRTLAEQRLNSFLYGLPELQVYLQNAGVGGLPFQPAHTVIPVQ